MTHQDRWRLLRAWLIAHEDEVRAGRLLDHWDALALPATANPRCR